MSMEDFLQYAIAFRTFAELHSWQPLLFGLLLGAAVGRFLERRHSFALIDDTVEEALRLAFDTSVDVEATGTYPPVSSIPDQQAYNEVELQKCIDADREDGPRAEALRRRLS